MVWNILVPTVELLKFIVVPTYTKHDGYVHCSANYVIAAEGMV